MMSMKYRTLELNIISAKDLKGFNLFSKTSVYAVVSISGDPLNPQTATTYIHRATRRNPTWNIPVKFIVNESLANQNCLSLEVKLLSHRKFLPCDTIIGTFHIPLKVLLDNTAGDSFRKVLCQVRKTSGKPKGTLNLSYKFGNHVKAPTTKKVAKNDDFGMVWDHYWWVLL